MSNEQIAVRIEALSKTYRLWDSPHMRLAYPFRRMINSVLPSRLRRDYKMDEGFREFHALKDISLEIRKGESWGFIGVNGSGKSTLLKIISGNLRPSSGRVEVDGKAAILDYSSGLNGEFTGRENILHKGILLGLTPSQVKERTGSIIEFADIGQFIDQPVKTYSSGMAARLGFAIMVHIDADILISDEALAVGDAFYVQKAMRYLRGFLKRGTFIFVSHSVNDVASLCQKAAWLDRGRIRAIGSAKEVTEAYIASASLQNSRRFIAETSVSEVAGKEAGQLLSEAPPAEGLVLGQPGLSELMNSRRPQVTKDPRLAYLNCSPWRNDIQIPEFPFDAPGFGVGGARIENVLFEDEEGNALSWVIGAEIVHLKIKVLAEADLQSPIVGFQVVDRLGQSLFADNTFLITLHKPFSVEPGQYYQADFCFQMPLLPKGEYAIRAATAHGMEDLNAMMHCIDTALLIRSTTSGARHGLVGVPMQQIKIEITNE